MHGTNKTERHPDPIPRPGVKPHRDPSRSGDTTGLDMAEVRAYLAQFAPSKEVTDAS